MRRKREEAAQVALKIACRIPAKCEQVFVESPDFALAESLPNFGAKRMRISLSLESRLQAVSPSGPRERRTPNVEKTSFFNTPLG